MLRVGFAITKKKSQRTLDIFLLELIESDKGTGWRISIISGIINEEDTVARRYGKSLQHFPCGQEHIGQKPGFLQKTATENCTCRSIILFLNLLIFYIFLYSFYNQFHDDTFMYVYNRFWSYSFLSAFSVPLPLPLISPFFQLVHHLRA